MGLAIISQAFPLTFSTLLEHLPRLGSEPLLIACVYLLSATLVPIATGTLDKRSLPLRASVAGTVMGIGIVTKVTFVPLLLFLFVFHGKKAKLFAALALVGSVIILTIPIWDRIPRIMYWFFRIVAHSGHYGQGDTGLPSASILLSNSFIEWD